MIPYPIILLLIASPFVVSWCIAVIRIGGLDNYRRAEVQNYINHDRNVLSSITFMFKTAFGKKKI